MKIVKKALYSTLMLACFSFVTSVSAQEKTATKVDSTKPRAVLFKVHEIKPVENEDGAITHCDFLVTFYNRTTESFRGATVNMGWTDKVSERYFSDTVEEPVENNVRRGRSSRDNEEKLGTIVTSVDMPSLGSYKQASVKASVKTEKCFLLLDNLNYQVSACTMLGQGEDLHSSRRSKATKDDASCANLFEYVDSKNPEYYDEFKNISFSEQERLLSEEKKHDTSDIESVYKEAIKNFEKAESVLGNI